MSVIGVNELWPGRQGSDDFKRHRLYDRVFEVYTNDPYDGPAVAGGSLLLPRLGDSHPEDSQAVCVSVNPVQDEEDPLKWTVTCKFNTQPELPESLQPDAGSGGAEQTPADIPDNPLDRPVVWRIGFQQTTEVFRSAYQTNDDGLNIGGSKPVVNSAGDLFDPPVTIEVSRPFVAATVNVANLEFSHLTEVQDAVNNAAWKGMDAFTVRCVGIDAQSGYENGVHFWSVTYNFALKDDGWLLRVLDAGFRYKWPTTDNPGRMKEFTDAYGTTSSSPGLLNGSGLPLPAGDPEQYLLFSAYKQRDFAALIPL